MPDYSAGTYTAHRFGGLDALRGVAALGVLGIHFREYCSPTYCFPGGYLAVDLFFLLSGFVVAYAYDGRLAAGMTTSAFLQRRLLRFLPLLWLGIAIGAASLTWHLVHEKVDYTKRDIILAVLHNALLLPTNFGPNNVIFPDNWPEWSLFLELIANLAYAVFHRFLTTRVLAIFTALMIIPLVVTAVHFHSLDVGSEFKRGDGGLARVAFSFPAGLLLYRTRTRWSPHLPTMSIWGLAALLVLILMIPIPGPWRAAYDLGAVVILSPLLIAAGSHSTAATGRAGGLAVWLGLISYPVYAVHFPVTDWLGIVMGPHPRPWSWQAITAAIGIVVSAAWLERNYHRRVSTWLSRMLG